MRKISKRIAVVTAAVAVLGTAGVAYAAWTITGTGTATAKATSASELTTATATVEADLYPGASGNVTIVVKNPNRFPVLVHDVKLDGAVTTDKDGCTAANSGVSVTLPLSTSIEIAAGGETTAVFTAAATMSNDSANACQGATFTVPVKLLAASNAK